MSKKKLLVDIGYTAELIGDYLIDKQYIQAKRHLIHLKEEIKELGKKMFPVKPLSKERK